jgi:hypothetical protein
MFQAVVDYHNKLAQARFTIAGLYLTATSFLVSTWFGAPKGLGAYPTIPLLGILFTFVCFLLESRTSDLLKHLGDRGKKIEKSLLGGLQRSEGFFDLMEHQPWPSLSSHTGALYILYGLIGSFWIVLLFSGPILWLPWWPLHYRLP